ncbi:NEL-type E3 ubiquitin ligase domain-containing protein [Bordetella genomosp. 9]|nr:NEL-type E3 ubiquitin ligase domain-containing protein [Bordetella genomosp. 9]
MTSTGPCGSPSTVPPVDTYSIAEPPALRDLSGLLTVQEPDDCDEWEMAQVETALRIIADTDIGAALLRAVRACDVPANDTPAFVFEIPEDVRSGVSDRDETTDADGNHIIRFEPQPFIHAATDPADGARPEQQDAEWQRQQAIDLFDDLAAYYATRIGQRRTAPELGYGEYSTLTFRDQLGDPVPQWQRDMAAYVSAAAGPDERRDLAWALVNMWSYAGDPTQPLRLISLGLREMPPLHNLASLQWLILAGNRLGEFPAPDMLPATLTMLDVAGNPIETPVRGYGPHLRQVTADAAMCARLGLRARLPAEIELVETSAEYANNLHVATRVLLEFPEMMANVIPVEEMELQGYTSEIMAPVYPPGLLDSAARKWLAAAPATDSASELPPASEAWRKAQDVDANAVAALSALLNRLHDVWLKQPDRAFRNRIVALLTKMRQPGKEKFLDECLSIARYGSGSCQDQILHTMNSLHIASLNCDIEEGVYDDKPFALLDQGEDMLNMDTLIQHFAELRPELQARAALRNIEFDEVEQWLDLLTRLRGRTYLPAMQFKMHFEHMSVVEPSDAERASEKIAAGRNARFFDFLATWTPLQTVIRRVSPELIQRAEKWRDFIYNDRGRVFALLNRMMNAERVFAARRESGMAVFPVRPRMFWTPYEKQVQEYLAQRGLRRDMPDVLTPACSAVSKDIEVIIGKAVVREFIGLHRLRLHRDIEWEGTPFWFNRIRYKLE